MNRLTRIAIFVIIAIMSVPTAMAITASQVNTNIIQEVIITEPLTQVEEDLVIQYVPDLFIPEEQAPADPEPTIELQKTPLGFDLVSCSISSDTLVLATNDQVSMNCDLKAEADLTAGIIVEGKHNAFENEAENATEVKKVAWNIGTQSPGAFAITWNGENEVDLKIAPGEYTFVVAAIIGGFDPDYSLQHVTVIAEAPVVASPDPDPTPTPTPSEVSQPGETSTTITEQAEDLPTNEQCAGFPDVSGDDPLCPAIEYVKSIGAITGTGTGHFDPNSKLQRDQIAKITLEAFGLFDEKIDYCLGNEAFSDAAADKWSYQYICQAKKIGAVTGYPDGTFKPAQLVNRVEFLALILRNLAESLPETGEDYDDANGNEWYSDYTRFAFKHSLFLGSNLNLTQSITRVEVAQILYRLHTLGKI